MGAPCSSFSSRVPRNGKPYRLGAVVEWRATDLNGAESRPERSQQILPAEEKPHAPVTKPSVDLGAQFCVLTFGIGPVETRLLVVNGVIAVAEEQEVEQLALEVAILYARCAKYR